MKPLVWIPREKHHGPPCKVCGLVDEVCKDCRETIARVVLSVGVKLEQGELFDGN